MQPSVRIISVRAIQNEGIFADFYELFPELWGAFLANPKIDSGKVNRSLEVEGEGYDIAVKYQFGARKPFWKLTVNGVVLQRSTFRDGIFSISSLDSEKNLFKEESYGAEQNDWLSTRYFSHGNITCELSPNSDDESLLLTSVEPVSGGKDEFSIYPCHELDLTNARLREILFSSIAKPSATAVSTEGTVAYFTSEQLESVKAFLTDYANHPEAVIASIPSADEVMIAALAADSPSVSDSNITVSEQLPSASEILREIAPAGEESAETDKPKNISVETSSDNTTVVNFRNGDQNKQIEYDEQGNLLYAGAVRVGERSGFGISMTDDNTVFAGTWLYGGRHGVSLSLTPDSACHIHYEDALRLHSDAAIFSSQGKLLFAGGMKNGAREGFGLSQTASQLWYVGTWHNDQPHGKGIFMDDHGAIIYCGDCQNGLKCGIGTEYLNGTEHYRGGWLDDRYDGNGLLHGDGFSIIGEFSHGLPHGTVKQISDDNRLIYEGKMYNGKYHGAGTLYLENGDRIEGQFVDGRPDSTSEYYSANGELIYRGGFSDLKYSGRGTLFCNGTAVYEGNFANGLYEGSGKQLFASGSTLYAGSFKEGVRYGIGAQFDEDGNPLYFGQWANDLPNGCAIRYENGVPSLVGSFVNGAACGRVNKYNSNGALEKELLCENDVPVYMVEYSDAGLPVYAGAVHNGARNGMGRLLNASGECEAQGIFSNGTLIKSVQVMLRTMSPLQCPGELAGTDYASFALSSERFVLDMPFCHGLYSGHIKDSQPSGNGTLVLSTHCYTGSFEDGAPSGEGKLYLSTGETVHGIFGNSENCESLCIDGLTYNFIRVADVANEAADEL